MSSRREKVIGRRIAEGFALVSLVTAGLCVALLWVLSEVGGHVQHMRKDEVAIRHGLELALAVREQYIHVAHGIVSGDLTHLDHYRDWVAAVDVSIVALRPRVDRDQRARLDEVGRRSDALDRIVRERIVPALLRGDPEAVRAAHHQAENLSAGASADADAIARSIEARMASAHIDATRANEQAVWIALAGILLVVVVSVIWTIRIRAAVLMPLATLTEAARRIGEGDFAARVGPLAGGELGTVAEALDRMADELREREQRLVARERMAAIGELAAGVAHEINNPIGVIRGYLRTMVPEAASQALRDELRILDEESAACERIAADLLAYACAGDLSREDVPIDELLRETARRFGTTAEAAGHRIDVGAAPAFGRLDSVRIRQVIVNLLRNAAQVSPAGEAIELRGEPVAGGYRITISDRGPGVADTDRARIFEPFFSHRPGGSGLGLSVCHGIVVAHGGTIEARSRAAGSGLEMVVWLPAQEHARVAA